MKSIFTLNKSTLISGLFAVLASALLLVHAPVQAVSTGAQVQTANKEYEDIMKRITQELDRRLAELEKTLKEMQQSDMLPAQVQTKLKTYITQAEAAIKKLKEEAGKTKTLEAAKALGKKVDEQYEKFKTANASGKLTNTLNSQNDIQKDIDSSVGDIQKIIDEAMKQAQSAQSGGANGGNVQIGGTSGLGGAGGGNSGGFNFEPQQAQEMLEQLKSLAATAAAIIASIIALILSLINGDFAGAAAIFATILGQLMTAQGMQGNSAQGLNSLGSQLTGGKGNFGTFQIGNGQVQIGGTSGL